MGTQPTFPRKCCWCGQTARAPRPFCPACGSRWTEWMAAVDFINALRLVLELEPIADRQQRKE